MSSKDSFKKPTRVRVANVYVCTFVGCHIKKPFQDNWHRNDHWNHYPSHRPAESVDSDNSIPHIPVPKVSLKKVCDSSLNAVDFPPEPLIGFELDQIVEHGSLHEASDDSLDDNPNAFISLFQPLTTGVSDKRASSVAHYHSDKEIGSSLNADDQQTTDKILDSHPSASEFDRVPDSALIQATATSSLQPLVIFSLEPPTRIAEKGRKSRVEKALGNARGVSWLSMS
jgi:hypothetical protein